MKKDLSIVEAASRSDFSETKRNRLSRVSSSHNVLLKEPSRSSRSPSNEGRVMRHFITSGLPRQEVQTFVPMPSSKIITKSIGGELIRGTSSIESQLRFNFRRFSSISRLGSLGKVCPPPLVTTKVRYFPTL